MTTGSSTVGDDEDLLAELRGVLAIVTVSDAGGDDEEEADPLPSSEDMLPDTLPEFPETGGQDGVRKSEPRPHEGIDPRR